MRKRRNPETIAGRVAGTGAIIAGDGFIVQRTVAGTYIVTLGDFRLLSATATAAYATSVDSYTANAFRVQTFNTAAVVSDFPFSFIAAAVAQ